MGWSLELTRFHGPNMVIGKVVTGMSRTPIVVKYLLLSTLANLSNIEEALVRFRGQEPIVLVDINKGLDEAQNPCSQIVANLLTEFVLINLIHHYHKHICCFHLKTWTQVRQVTVFRERLNYILGTN